MTGEKDPTRGNVRGNNAVVRCGEMLQGRQERVDESDGEAGEVLRLSGRQLQRDGRENERQGDAVS